MRGNATAAGPGVPVAQGRIGDAEGGAGTPAGEGGVGADSPPVITSFTHSAPSSGAPQAWHDSTPGSFAASQLSQIAPRADNGNPTERTIPGPRIQV